MKKSDDIKVLNFAVWDSERNAADRLHIMPIITPVYPQLKFAYNVSRFTFEVMKEEFRISLGICQEIFDGKASWDKLFETTNSFKKYATLSF